MGGVSIVWFDHMYSKGRTHAAKTSSKSFLFSLLLPYLLSSSRNHLFSLFPPHLRSPLLLRKPKLVALVSRGYRFRLRRSWWLTTSATGSLTNPSLTMLSPSKMSMTSSHGIFSTTIGKRIISLRSASPRTVVTCVWIKRSTTVLARQQDRGGAKKLPIFQRQSTEELLSGQCMSMRCVISHPMVSRDEFSVTSRRARNRPSMAATPNTPHRKRVRDESKFMEAAIESHRRLLRCAKEKES